MPAPSSSRSTWRRWPATPASSTSRSPRRKASAWSSRARKHRAISAQRELLAQAVANLLDNAVKYTPDGGRILVQVSEAGGEVVLTVSDSGPGVPSADQARVLDPFVRLEEARSSPGAGLGLSLVAAVAKLHGAALRLDDAGPGLKVELRFKALWPGAPAA